MKRITSTLALFVASLFITAGVWAQAVKATVPFDFTIDNTTVPAGTYIISSTSSDHDVLRISDQKHVHLLTTAIMDSGNAAKGNVLVFHKYGDTYFLSQVARGSGETVIQLAISKQENEAQIQNARSVSAEEVVVAAK